MKWEPVAAMVLLLALGFWLARDPGVPGLRAGATTQRIQLGAAKGVLETVTEPGAAPSYRLVFRDGAASPVMSEAELAELVTAGVAAELARARGNPIFRLLNITTWVSVAWVGLGFLGQAAFSGRMLLQWFVSERRRESIVTIGFWWMSLVGGVILFTYFVWRQDIVGVLGQSTGVVIYARNIRLHYKKLRRAEREALRTASVGAVEPKHSPVGSGAGAGVRD